MQIPPTVPTVQEHDLLATVRGADEQGFGHLVAPYRSELHAHCYRMLGSVHDAEDAVQETLLRAWRAIARFEGRSTLRSWLYTIATNVCLDQIARRSKRGLPVDRGPATDPHAGPGDPVLESVWVEPYPDEAFGLADLGAGPGARYEMRESVELAFIVALQCLPGTQRAVLILREVLGYSAAEVAEALDTTVASVNSALQRARKTLGSSLPERSQQATLGALGDEELRAIVTGYVDAWERADVEAVVAMLTHDATFAMPPLASWFAGRESIAAFLAGWPMSGAWRWRHRHTRANGQPALAFYAYDEAQATYLPFALNVLTFRGSLISDVTAFVNRSTRPTRREAYHRWVEQPTDPYRLAATFGRFSLPERLD